MVLFTTTNYPVNALISDIELGKLGLPELQRPFVWPNVNVRNLFDSLYRGYPAGFLLFWETGAGPMVKGIGTKNSKVAPSLVIVDGQQRLTSLYAVMKGAEVTRANFNTERIQIAFNPLTERFDVADAAIRKDKSYIPDISLVWSSASGIFAFANNYIQELQTIRELSIEQIAKAQDAIGKLQKLSDFQFVALTLYPNVDAETIADVFVRINGEGKQLNQSDFIMTLMSVFWDEGRTQLETFARRAAGPPDGQPSPRNNFIQPAPDQMLRASIGLALKRARLASVYNVLRGRDVQTGLDDPNRRTEQFASLQTAQAHVLNLSNWHHFLSSLTLAGYRRGKMISSQTTVIYCYVLYLIGTVDYHLPKKRLRQAIAEFFFMSALTSRYTSSPESRFESDLGMLKDLPDAEAFLAKLREIAATTLTSDYWTITLPSHLATSASRSPSLFAYIAAQVKLEAPALYSPMKVADLIDPAVTGPKASLEQHHLFPAAFLQGKGIIDTKIINQIANKALVEWPDNSNIGSRAPSDYAPHFDLQLNGKQRSEMYNLHALPHLWWEKPYDDFLVDRRQRMAAVIKQAWERLVGDDSVAPADVINVKHLIDTGETDAVEFKSTLRTNLHTGFVDEKMHLAVLKTIGAFLNVNGGTLLVGVSDDGDMLGLEADGFATEDKMGLHLVNLIKDRIGDVFLPYVHSHFEDEAGQRILVVRCESGPKPAFVKDGGAQRFYVRGGNATIELSGASLPEYVKQRYG